MQLSGLENSVPLHKRPRFKQKLYQLCIIFFTNVACWKSVAIPDEHKIEFYLTRNLVGNEKQAKSNYAHSLQRQTQSWICYNPTVAEWSRRTYPAPLGAGGVGSIPANSDAQNVPSFRRWRFVMKLSPCYNRLTSWQLLPSSVVKQAFPKMRANNTIEQSTLLTVTCCSRHVTYLHI